MAHPPTDSATREHGSRVALVTCDLHPGLYADDLPLRDALLARGIEVDAVAWESDQVDWDAYAVSVLRSTWNYVPRRDEFVSWARRVPRLANPADVVAWNTDKRYLAELADAGVPVIPTSYVAPGETWTPPDSGNWVIKPTISAGSQDTARYEMPAQAGLAAAHVDRLTAAGRTAMVQPFLSAVDTYGETSVLCLPDATGATGSLGFSHAIRKGPMIRKSGGGRIDPGSEDISTRTPTEAELAVADRVLAQLPAGLLYARIDLIPGPGGDPLLVEVELTEPSLFFRTAPKAADRLADAIVARLG